jgi:hypothetical protein
MWMAFREIYCNCLDEGGRVSREEPAKDPYLDNHPGVSGVLVLNYSAAGQTVIAVKGDLIEQEYHNRDQNFLRGEPVFSDGSVEIHRGKRPYIFYKGVRVHAMANMNFTYNLLTKMDLTEDRTLKYSWDAVAKISKCVMQLTDKGLIREILRAPAFSFERDNLAFSEAYAHSREFEEEAVRQYKLDPIAINQSVRKLIKHVKPAELYSSADLTKVQQRQLEKSLAFVQAIGYPADAYKVTIVETLGPTAMAMALREHDEIVISKQCFDKGTKYLTSTILEEVIHLREGLDDETRSMQTYLFDKIISLGEELQGEPL